MYNMIIFAVFVINDSSILHSSGSSSVHVYVMWPTAHEGCFVCNSL